VFCFATRSSGIALNEMGSLPTWGGLRAAVAFLTRVPVGSRALDARDFRRAPALFPVVGGGIGLFACVVYSLATPLSAFAAAVLTVAFTTYWTGAFHEDGLADTADALGGAVSRERSFEILKDSRIGSFGAAALVLSLLARVALLSELRAPALLALVSCHCLARLCPLWLMTHLPHALPEGAKSKDLLSPERSSAYVGFGLAVVIVAAAWWFDPVSLLRLAGALGAVSFVALWFYRLGTRRLGGHTGDLLGASEQVAEVGILASFVWAM
jgi:adenosylcobinamide-GDP ribazoletransferase